MERTDRIDIGSFIRAADAKCQPDWSWREFLSNLTYDLLGAVGYDFCLAVTPVEKVAQSLGISVSGGETLTDAELLKRGENWRIKVASNDVDPAYDEDELRVRGRFSLAHELAHYLVSNITSSFPGIADRYRLNIIASNPGRLESLCNEVSGEFLAPKRTFNELDRHRLKSAIGNDRSLTEIRSVDSLSRTLNVSRIVLIRQLNKTAVLDASECGFVVSFFGVNFNSGKSPALRIRYRALPNWGFIPDNKRLSNTGLWTGVSVFNDGTCEKPASWEGEIDVQEAPAITGDGPRWMNKTIKSHGEHVVCRFGRKQKYLISTFAWPDPDKHPETR